MVQGRGGEKRGVAACGGAIFGQFFEVKELAQAKAKPGDGQMERGLPGKDRPGLDRWVIGGDGGDALVPQEAPHAFPAIKAGIIARAGFALDQQVARIGVRRGAEGRKPAGADQQDIAGAKSNALRSEASRNVFSGRASPTHRTPIAPGTREMPREVRQHRAAGNAMGQRLINAIAALRPMHNRRKRRVIVETMCGVSEMRKPIPLRAALQPEAIQLVVPRDAAGVFFLHHHRGGCRAAAMGAFMRGAEGLVQGQVHIEAAALADFIPRRSHGCIGNAVQRADLIIRPPNAPGKRQASGIALGAREVIIARWSLHGRSLAPKRRRASPPRLTRPARARTWLASEGYNAMKLPRRALFAAAAALPLPALAQARSIRLVVPFAAGGAADSAARTLAPRMAERLGATIVVENRTGAGGSIGGAEVARAAPDGATLLWDASSHIVNHALLRGLSFDYATAFTPISMATSFPQVVAVKADFPAQNLAAFIAAAKARPGAITMGTQGNATAGHLGLVQFARAAGIEVIHAPYRGGADAARDLAGGNLDGVFITALSAGPVVDSGRARFLAVASAARLAARPDVPTIAESGFPGFDISEWVGLFAPTGTPAPVLARLHEALAASLAEPEVRARLAQLGAVPVGSSPEDFARFVREGRAAMTVLVREANIRVE